MCWRGIRGLFIAHKIMKAGCINLRGVWFFLAYTTCSIRVQAPMDGYLSTFTVVVPPIVIQRN